MDTTGPTFSLPIAAHATGITPARARSYLANGLTLFAYRGPTGRGWHHCSPADARLLAVVDAVRRAGSTVAGAVSAVQPHIDMLRSAPAAPCILQMRSGDDRCLGAVDLTALEAAIEQRLAPMRPTPHFNQDTP